jgi:regulator of sigma E protease
MTFLLDINWAVTGIKIGQLLLSLSILVVLHEFGHYITARWFKCKVEKFYLFFDPWFSLFKKKIGETEYGIGWLPLGGYVKIAGMVDESMDKNQLTAPPEPWEFRSKPAWQRLIIMLGGVTVNILLAFIIYSGILMVWGEKKIPMDSVQYGISIQDPVMYELGLKDGDKIVAANGVAIDDYNDVIKRIILSETLTIERGGQKQEITMPVNLIGTLVEKKRSNTPLLVPRIPSIVKDAPEDMPAYKAGIRSGDIIVSVNQSPTTFFDELRPVIEGLKGKTASVYVKRGEQNLTFQVPVNEEGKIGFAALSGLDDYQAYGILRLESKKYGFFEAIPAGVLMAGSQLKFYIDQFKKIFTPETGAYKGVGGFKSMGSIFPATWDWESFWNITAFFSIVLAFMNLLPIPALDGGHVVFTLIEMITGRKPSQKFLEVAQVVGMVLLLGLMLYANGNDFFGWGRGR